MTKEENKTKVGNPIIKKKNPSLRAAEVKNKWGPLIPLTKKEEQK